MNQREAVPHMHYCDLKCPSCDGDAEWADIPTSTIQCFFCGYIGPKK
jgi:ribosomal protein S27E